MVGFAHVLWATLPLFFWPTSSPAQDASTEPLWPFSIDCRAPAIESLSITPGLTATEVTRWVSEIHRYLKQQPETATNMSTVYAVDTAEPYLPINLNPQPLNPTRVGTLSIKITWIPIYEDLTPGYFILHKLIDDRCNTVDEFQMRLMSQGNQLPPRDREGPRPDLR